MDRRHAMKLAGAGVAFQGGASAQRLSNPMRAAFDVKTLGAIGDGKTLDTEPINRAIDAASTAGGGTVVFPAGTYATYSIRLKSNVTLYLGPGATILAAENTSTARLRSSRAHGVRQISGLRTQPLPQQPDLGRELDRHRDSRARVDLWQGIVQRHRAGLAR